MAEDTPKQPSKVGRVLDYMLMGMGSGLTGIDFIGNYQKQNEPKSIFEQWLQKKMIDEVAPEIGANIDINPKDPATSYDQFARQRSQSPLSGGIRPDVVDPMASMNAKQSNQQKIMQDIDKKSITDQMDIQKKKDETVVKWNEEGVDRQIKYDVLDPKLQVYMETGGRAYKELQDTAKSIGINLDYRKGGLEAIKAKIVKNGALAVKAAPLMESLNRLRPELGTEMMRQLGAFRSGAMAKRFEDSLPQFSGDIREDITNLTTTMAKNAANAELVDDEGNPLPREEKMDRIHAAEANLVRKYNSMYIGMGLMDKPYTGGRSFEWLAENSNFSEKEQALIDKAIADNPKADPIKVKAKLIEKGIL